MAEEGRTEAAAAQHEADEPAVYAEWAAIDELGTSRSELHLHRRQIDELQLLSTCRSCNSMPLPTALSDHSELAESSTSTFSPPSPPASAPAASPSSFFWFAAACPFL